MTPGYAKSRDELPWLPYRTSDKVIINSHNFGGGPFSPAVNGKMPIAAWIPSRDTAGNGTTTLTDLVGSNNGTLTNMDPATDWVADTAAGGVRALDFLASANQQVNIAHNAAFQPEIISASAWINIAVGDGSLNRAILSSNGFNGWELRTSEFRNNLALDFVYNNAAAQLQLARSAAVSSLSNTWVHVALSYEFDTPASLRLWINGTQRIASFIVRSGTGGQRNLPGNFTLSAGSSPRLSGLADDWRIWNVALDATDVADLYAAGLGRGIDAS